MSNYKYAIKKLPIKSWIKYWLWRNRTGGTKYKFSLSEIKEGSNFYLENTIKRKFNMFKIYGKTTQNGAPIPENPIPIVNLTEEIEENVINEDGTDEQNISFPLEQGQYLAQGDYLADDGIHHVRAKIIYDGSEDENWNKGSSSPSGSVAFYLSKPSDLSSTATLSDLLCSHFSNQEAVNGMRLASYLTFYPTTDLNVTTTSEWRTWLSTHNIELEYPLAEEVIEPYTEEQQIVYNQIKELYTYNEITNIHGDANLKIKYWERVTRDE